MNLLVIRHAIAMEREEFAQTGESDDLRPLTRKGIRKMKRIAEALRREVGELDQLASSPLTRAVQTAEIVGDAYGIENPETTTSLVPGTSFDELVKWVSRNETDKVVAIVGHEPHLSSLITWLIAGGNDSRVQLRKGGACLIEFESGIRRKSGTLVWLLTPRQLVAIAER